MQDACIPSGTSALKCCREESASVTVVLFTSCPISFYVFLCVYAAQAPNFRAVGANACKVSGYFAPKITGPQSKSLSRFLFQKILPRKSLLALCTPHDFLIAQKLILYLLRPTP